MLASSLSEPSSDSPEEGKCSLEASDDLALSPDCPLVLDSSIDASQASSDEYAQLQLSILKATLLATSIAVVISASFFELPTTTSLLVGAISGILYLRLLARSIEKLGVGSKNVSKIQLVIPIVLIIAVSRLPVMEVKADKKRLPKLCPTRPVPDENRY